MWKALTSALLAGALVALSPQVHAATPADTLVIAKQIDDLISMDPAEAYELSGIEILANTYDRIMRFEPTDITKHWRDDLVIFALGCSFSFEDALMQDGEVVYEKAFGWADREGGRAIERVGTGQYL